MQAVANEGPVLDKVVAALGQTPLFVGLPENNLKQVASRATLIQYDAGETVVTAGEASDSFFVILDGAVRVLVPGQNSGAVEVAVLHKPESIGEMGLLLESPRSATVLAKDKALLMKFDAQVFQVLYQRVDGFGMAIAKALAKRVHTSSRRIPLPDHADLEGRVPSPEVMALLPLEFMQRHRVVPVSSEANNVVLGFVDDPIPEVIGRARELLSSMPIEPVRIKLEFFEECMRSNASVSGWSGQDAAADDTPAAQSSPRLEALLRRMIAEGASDLHLSARHQPRWRIDGDMQVVVDVPTLSGNEAYEMLKPVMRQDSQDEFERDNDTDFAHAVEGLARFRVNLFRDQGGTCAVLRQIPAKILTIEQLGMPLVVQQLCEYPKGLVLVTGPTGSGKSTTLAAMIDYINRNKKTHIITLEDPVEFVHASQEALVNQREIGPHTNSFDRALRAALREDPDIVLVGEMRDLETVSLALETANTGHLVFGTLHTATAMSTVDRIIDFFPAEQQNQVRSVLADTLKGVVSQTLCKRIGGGRVAALEILVSNFAVANLIREAKIPQIASILATQKALGNRSLNEDLARLVKDKAVEYEEASGKSMDKADLAKRCGRPPGHG